MWQTDGLVELVSHAALAATNASRLAEDLEIYASEPFGFFRLAAEHCRASALMPQKRNPYALPVIRGAAGTLIGRAAELAATQRTPSGRTDNLLYAYGDTADAVKLATDAVEPGGRGRRGARARRGGARASRCATGSRWPRTSPRRSCSRRASTTAPATASSAARSPLAIERGEGPTALDPAALDRRGARGARPPLDRPGRARRRRARRPRGDRLADGHRRRRARRRWRPCSTPTAPTRRSALAASATQRRDALDAAEARLRERARARVARPRRRTTSGRIFVSRSPSRRLGAELASARMGRLDGKVAIVTGAGSGIGAATAQAVRGRGRARGRRRRARGRRRRRRRRDRRGGRRGDRARRRRLLRRRRARARRQRRSTRWGRLDALYNNAGVDATGDVLDVTAEDWDRCFDVNVKGTWLCSKHAVPAMEDSGGGAIVNQGSVAALVGIRRFAAYCAAKGAVVSLTRAMALDLAPRKIRVNCICPGTVLTPLMETMIRERGGGDLDKGIAMTVEKYPLGRLGDPEDVAARRAVSRQRRRGFVTGSIYTADGGMTAQ